MTKLQALCMLVMIATMTFQLASSQSSESDDNDLDNVIDVVTDTDTDIDTDDLEYEGSEEEEPSRALRSSKWGWRQGVLDRHNKYRKLHGAKPLVLDQTLVNMAQKTADYLAKKRLLAHVSKNIFHHKYGENLATTHNKDKEKAGVDATDRWYKEVANYRYSSPGFTMKTGHFTQVVWKESTKVGFGYAMNGNFGIVVAQYSPSGNFGHSKDYARNVAPPK